VVAEELPSAGSSMPLRWPSRLLANRDLMGDIMGGGFSGCGLRRRLVCAPCSISSH
jgi:hypothetical protein